MFIAFKSAILKEIRVSLCQNELNILQYMENDIKDLDLREMEEHLFSCSECKKNTEDFKLILNTAKGIEVPEPEPDFWNTFNVRLNERLEEPGFFLNIFRPVVAGVLFAAIITFLPFNYSIDDQQELDYLQYEDIPVYDYDDCHDSEIM
jgi:hypothetical protein